MPFILNVVDNTVQFSEYEITEDILSGRSEIINNNPIVHLIDNTDIYGNLFDMNIKYPNMVFKCVSTVPVNNERIVNTEIIKKPINVLPSYKLKNLNEPTVYINKKFLT